MDSSRFDSLARTLSDAGTDRRTLTGLLGGALLAALPIATEARKKRQRHKHSDDARKDHHGTGIDSEKKKKKKKKCKPESAAVTCAGKCGSVTNNCKQGVTCGSCACSPACGVCFTCQAGANTPGTCVADPQKVDQPCGGPGQVCQANGACVCSNSACSNPTPVCGQEFCEACTNDAQCQTAGKGDICCNGSCFAGDCCDNTVCANPTPICTQHTCSACTNTSECGNKEICDNGSCEACDVCANDCAYQTPEQAIKVGWPSATEPITARICPGTYGRVFKDLYTPDVTLIGAGDGEDPAYNTIFTDVGSDDAVARFEGGTSTLRGVRVTGGNGGGVLNNFASLSLADCSIIGNSIVGVGGGIQNNGVLNATNVKAEGNVASNQGGGLFNFSGSTITFAGSNLVAENTLTDPGSAFTGSGISNQGDINGIATVTIRDNVPADSQCFGCPS